MNIFYLDSEIKNCAQYLCDKHVVKMVLETAQMLCTTLNEYGYESPYRSVNKNHPCTKWARESKENFSWLCKLGLEIADEYTYRYGKTHKSREVILYCLNNIPIEIPTKVLSIPPKCYPDLYDQNDTINGYRQYYINEKSRIAVYTKREAPYWLKGSN